MNAAAHGDHAGVVRASLAASLAESEDLLAWFMNEAVERLGSAALAALDLPPLTGAPIDAAQLRVAAVLLWAREVEAAGVLPFVEGLASAVVGGTIFLPITAAGDRLGEFHKRRGDRLTEGERRALFERVFDGGTVALFEALVARLDELGRDRDLLRSSHGQARVTLAARQLAVALSARTAGFAAFAAREIVAAVREALDLLRDPDLAAALGPGGVSNVLRWHGQMVLGRSVDPSRHFARARAGQQVLAWLASVALRLEDGGAVVAAGDAVLTDASSWKELGGPP